MKTKTRWKKAYTFVEVLVASALLGGVIGGAVKLIGTLNISEDTARNGTVALNILDNAIKLWRLGLTTAEVLSIMPKETDNDFTGRALVADGSGNTVTFSAVSNVTLANSMGTLETVTATVVIEDIQGNSNRTVSLQAYRPTAR